MGKYLALAIAGAGFTVGFAIGVATFIYCYLST